MQLIRGCTCRMQTSGASSHDTERARLHRGPLPAICSAKKMLIRHAQEELQSLW